MVATLVRLRLRILGHALRRDTWRLVLLILGLLWGLSLLPGLAGAMLWLAREPAEFATEILVVAGSLVVAGWAVVPLLVPGMDDSLDISRFAIWIVLIGIRPSAATVLPIVASLTAREKPSRAELP